jgi:2'-5' RNA ligase
MHQTLELLLDAPTEAKLQAIINRFPDDTKNPPTSHPLIRPHITLLAAPSPVLAEHEPDIEKVLSEALPLPIALSHLGIFPGPKSTIFVGITASQALLNLHRRLCEAVQCDEQIFPHYRRESLVFHSTLREGVLPAQLARFCESAGTIIPPGRSGVRTARLMEYGAAPRLLRAWP